jgi:hypothetical protein
MDKVKVAVPVVAGVLGGLGALFGMFYTGWKWRARHKVLKMEPYKLSLAEFGTTTTGKTCELPVTMPKHSPHVV